MDRDDAKAWVVSLLDVVPGIRRLLREIARVEVIDRALVIAAQSLFSVVPLLIVIAAFSPHHVKEALVEEVSHAMGVEPSQTPGLDDIATSSDQVRTQTGIGGVFVVLVSALSFARALQRMFERVWQLPHLGGVLGNKRCLYWLVSWVVYLQLIAVLSGAISGREFGWLRLTVQVGISVAAWWWTARMLLLGRKPWGPLLLGALLTGIGIALLSHFSSLVMPAYVQANVEQFGGLGVLFAASTWLLAFGGVIVVGTLLGRVYSEEWPFLRRLTGADMPPPLETIRVRHLEQAE